jgi:hypothetical protein
VKYEKILPCLAQRGVQLAKAGYLFWFSSNLHHPPGGTASTLSCRSALQRDLFYSRIHLSFQFRSFFGVVSRRFVGSSLISTVS